MKNKSKLFIKIKKTFTFRYDATAVKFENVFEM